VTPAKAQLSKAAAATAGEDRRHSQRVVISLPVKLVVIENGRVAEIVARTVEVNTHGAMLACARSFESNTKLELVNGQTREGVACRVTRSPREGAAGFLVPVEFISPSPNFWQITFPPSNWKPLEG
jgi:hypothetical protein